MVAMSRKLPYLGGAQQLMGCDIKPKQLLAQWVPQWALAQAARTGIKDLNHAASNAATMACAFAETVLAVSPGL